MSDPNEDILWAIRIVGDFITNEIDNRSAAGGDMSDYINEPREAYGAFIILRAAALKNSIAAATKKRGKS